MAIVPGDKAAHKRLISFFSQPVAPCPSLRPAAGRLRGGAAGWVASWPLVLVTLPRWCVAASAVAAAVATVSSGGGGNGSGAGFFPGGVAFDDFFPCQRWDWRCRTFKFKVGEERDVLEDVPEEKECTSWSRGWGSAESCDSRQAHARFPPGTSPCSWKHTSS